MRLFEPRNSTMNSEVFKSASSFVDGFDFWLGISDLPRKDGLYHYESDKKEVESGMWASHIRIDPEMNTHNHHCVSFFDFGSGPRWQNSNCNLTWYYSICEEIKS